MRGGDGGGEEVFVEGCLDGRRLLFVLRSFFFLFLFFFPLVLSPPGREGKAQRGQQCLYVRDVRGVGAERSVCSSVQSCKSTLEAILLSQVHNPSLSPHPCRPIMQHIPTEAKEQLTSLPAQARGWGRGNKKGEPKKSPTPYPHPAELKEDKTKAATRGKKEKKKKAKDQNIPSYSAPTHD